MYKNMKGLKRLFLVLIRFLSLTVLALKSEEVEPFGL